MSKQALLAEHELRAQARTGATADALVDIREGESREVELKISVLAPATPPPAVEPHSSPTVLPIPGAPPAREGWNVQRTVGALSFGGGVAAVLTAGVLCALAKTQDDTAANEAFPAKHDDSVAASHLADTATVVGSIGAAFALAGGVLWLTAPRNSVVVGAGNGLWVRGKF